MSHSYHLSNFIHQLHIAQRNLRPVFTYEICSNFILDNVRLLLREGFIANYTLSAHLTLKDVKSISVTLRYSSQRRPLIQDVRIYTTPGHVITKTYKDVKSFYNRNRVRFVLGCYVFTTPYGLKTDLECMRLGIGGKLLYSINLVA